MKKKKQYRLTKKRPYGLTIILVLICILFALAVATVFKMQDMFKREMVLSDAFQKVDAPVELYTFDIDGDYYFDEFIDRYGGASSDAEVSAFLTEKISHGFYTIPVNTGETACSVISAQDKNGAHVWGRNFDWGDPAIVIVRSRPENGYASISTCDFHNISDDPDILTSENLVDRFMRIAAYYVPLDGINEAGLCVADLQVNEGGMTENMTDKPDLTVTTAIRLLLNRAATVEEAIELLDGFDIHPSGGISHHLAISDANGDSVVLEFVEGRTEVVERHYVTNFTLYYDDTLAGGVNAQQRYLRLREEYRDHEGVLSLDRIRRLLSETAQHEGDCITRWSIVYGGGNSDNDRTVTYYFNGDFDTPYTFELLSGGNVSTGDTAS